MNTFKTATLQDFKEGVTLISKYGEWEFTLRNKYDDGVWESDKSLIFEHEAQHYFVKP